MCWLTTCLRHEALHASCISQPWSDNMPRNVSWLPYPWSASGGQGCNLGRWVHGSITCIPHWAAAMDRWHASDMHPDMHFTFNHHESFSCELKYVRFNVESLIFSIGSIVYVWMVAQGSKQIEMGYHTICSLWSWCEGTCLWCANGGQGCNSERCMFRLITCLGQDELHASCI